MAATAFGGAVITPYFDSLLVKLIASGTTLDEAVHRMDRALREFRVRGVKTNIPFLENLIHHPTFIKRRRDDDVHRQHARTLPLPRQARPGHEDPELSRRRDRQRPAGRERQSRSEARIPRAADPGVSHKATPPPPGTAATSCWNWARRNSPSGSASRSGCSSPTPRCAMPINRCWPRACARSICSPVADAVGPSDARTFQPGNVGRRDVRHRPCGSCRKTRGIGSISSANAIPNILFQMLLRASNAVGYTNYPDNVVARIRQAIGRARHRCLPHFRFAQLDRKHEGRDGGRARENQRASAKPPSATPAISSTPNAPNTA